MKKKILFAISITTLLIASCKKNNADTPAAALIEVKFAAEALEYVQLPLNKYFIYKDSATGTLDSVVVTKSNLEKLYIPAHKSAGLFDPNTPEYYYQKFSLTLTSYTSGKDWFSGEASSNKLLSTIASTNDAIMLFTEKNNDIYASASFAFVYPLGTSNFASAVLYPTINIEGKTYTNAIAYTASNGFLPSDNNYRRNTNIWVKGLGIIKREVQTSGTTKTDLLVRNG